MGDYSLPPLEVPVTDMTRDHLRKFIPSLICQAEGKNRFKIGIDEKPQWWPLDIPWYNLRTDTRTDDLKNQLPWTEALRDVVRKCYVHYGAEHMLTLGEDSTIQVVNSIDGSVSFIAENTPIAVEQQSKLANDGKLDAATLPTPARLIHNKAYRPEPILTNTASYKAKYLKSLKLIPKSSLNKLNANKDRKIFVDNLDDDQVDVIEEQMKSPTTPKTPKSLISQMSRDLSPPGKTIRRKSLMLDCVQENGHHHHHNHHHYQGDADVEDEIDNTSKVLDTDKPNEEENGEEKRIRHMKIMNIDYSSPLGVRIGRLMQVQAENSFSFSDKVSAPEEFCHTPKKNPSVGRLRNRAVTFPLCFRKSRKTCPKYPHTYKFTKAQRKEWFKTSLTGINARARALKRQWVTKCSVRLRVLSKKEIREWTRRKSRPSVSVNLSQFSNQRLMNQSILESMLQGKLITSPDGKQYVLPNTAAGFVNGNILKNSSNIIDLTPQSGYTFKSKYGTSASPPRPVQLIANGGDQQQELDLSKLLKKPLQSRFNSNAFQSKGPISRQSSSSSNSVSNKGSNKRKLEQQQNNDEEVICLSSDDSSESTPAAKPPPKKKARVKPPPTLLFKCHLCHNELTCTGNFSEYIEGHFSASHNVNNIQLIEHTDSNGAKVVSIVEKVNKKKAVQHKAQMSPSVMNGGRNNYSKGKAKSVAMKSTTKSAAARRAAANLVSEEVICID